MSIKIKKNELMFFIFKKLISKLKKKIFFNNLKLKQNKKILKFYLNNIFTIILVFGYIMEQILKY